MKPIIAGLCTGPLILFFQGSYGTAAATVSLIYLVGLIAGCVAKEPERHKLGPAAH